MKTKYPERKDHIFRLSLPDSFKFKLYCAYHKKTMQQVIEALVKKVIR